MTDHTSLPRDVLMDYPVITEATFPHGLMCCHCRRVIGVGQPFDRHVTKSYSNGDTMSHLACVYCPCPEALVGAE